MIANRLLLALLVFVMLTGMRDPFAPQPDRCHIAQLSQWRYQGFIAMGGNTKGIVQDADGRWRRASPQDVLPTGWRVGEITRQQMQIYTAAGCEPQQWQWTREEPQSEKTDAYGGAVQHGDVRHSDKQRGGGQTEAGHADRGRRTDRTGAANAGGAGKT
nr:HofP DNA utilization family protein [uncultured Enterobacter sp.]